MNEVGTRRGSSSSALLALVLIAVILIGGVVTIYLALQVSRLSTQMSSLQGQVDNLHSQISGLEQNQTISYMNITIYQNSTALSELFESIKDSIVLVRGTTSTGDVQGSGFVYNFTSLMVVVTNYHVVHGTSDLSVTFSNGNGYSATINGTDPYADLAVLVVSAPSSEFKPLELVASSTLGVGDPVIAIGNPYGLVGSLTTGVVSALGRTITEDQYTGGFAIANVIQTSAPINPGNSGGPLLNYVGRVVGVTTAIVEDSQGLGFAIPSNTILREIPSLVRTGTYANHSYLGIAGTSMDYALAQQYSINVTYGWYVVEVNATGPSYNILTVGDVIVGMNGTKIRSSDELSSFLEEHTLPSESIILTVVRGSQTLELVVVLGTRPRPPV